MMNTVKFIFYICFERMQRNVRCDNLSRIFIKYDMENSKEMTVNCPIGKFEILAFELKKNKLVQSLHRHYLWLNHSLAITNIRIVDVYQ